MEDMIRLHLNSLWGHGHQNDDNLLAVRSSLSELRRLFHGENEKEAATLMFECGAIPALTSVLKNYHDQDRLLWTASQIFLFMMFIDNDPDAKIRSAFINSGGASALLDAMRENLDHFSVPTSQMICCIFLWIAVDERLRSQMANIICSASSSSGAGAAVSKFFNALRRHRNSEGFVVCTVMLLDTMADDAALRVQIGRALAQEDGISVIVQILQLHPDREDIVTGISRLLCSLYSDADAATTRNMQNVPTKDIGETILAVAPLHEGNHMVQCQICFLLELLAARCRDFVRRVDLNRLTERVVRAMDLHLRDPRLQRSSVRLLTRLLKERDDSVPILNGSDAVRTVGKVLRSHRSDNGIVISGHGFLRALAVKNRDGLKCVLLSLRRPYLSVTTRAAARRPKGAGRY